RAIPGVPDNGLRPELPDALVAARRERLPNLPRPLPQRRHVERLLPTGLDRWLPHVLWRPDAAPARALEHGHRRPASARTVQRSVRNAVLRRRPEGHRAEARLLAVARHRHDISQPDIQG